ncbi:MAG: class A beta-lactamase [Woeseia sp.]
MLCISPASSRRRLVFTSVVALFLFATVACGPVDDGSDDTFANALNEMEQQINGRIGAFAVDTGSGRQVGHRADERFAMASTFKVLLVAAVLAEVDAGRLSLDDKFTLDDTEIQSYSPIIGELQADEEISLLALCRASVVISDNTASNMLLDLVGGPPGLTRFLRGHGDSTTRLDRYEVELNTNLPDDARDTTTPAAIAASLQRLLLTEGLADGLSDESRTLLQDWLKSSTTGLKRLRAGIPAGWQVGDKTGYGGNGAVNDVAIVWPPGRPPVVIAVYMSGTAEKVDVLNAVHARIAALAIEQLAR